MQQVAQTLEFFLNGMLSLTWILFNFYIVAVEFRFLISWFLNINPYFEPLLSLWLWTNPVFCFGRSFYPKILGFDPAPIINFQILYFVQGKLGKYVKNVNNGTPPTPGMDSETNPNPESFSTPDWIYDVRDWLQNFSFKAKGLVSESADKTESSKNFFETVTFYVKKGILDKPDAITTVQAGSGEHSTNEFLAGIGKDSTVEFVSNFNTHLFAEQVLTPLAHNNILNQFYSYSLDFSTLVDNDFLSQLSELSHYVI
jgi:uncharacterized protein YggT (Ycf19 family)